MKKCNRILNESKLMLAELKELAMEGETLFESPENLRLYSLMWDISLKLTRLVEQEIKSHKTSGKWD